MQERRKFGSMGWNSPYSFTQSDLECSILGLATFLNEAEEQVPWPALEYMLGQINYGGHVTDDMDRRCLMSTLRRFITPKVLDDDYKFTPMSGTYYAPKATTMEQFRQAALSVLLDCALCLTEPISRTVEHHHFFVSLYPCRGLSMATAHSPFVAGWSRYTKQCRTLTLAVWH